MFSLSEGSLLLSVQSCIAAQNDPAVREEGLVWTDTRHGAQFHEGSFDWNPQI